MFPIQHLRIRHFTLKTAVHRLEDSVITLSGPALAISGIIAGVDLLTGGHLLQSLGWLSTTWAICLLLTLDFQVLSLGERARILYQSAKSRWHKSLELGLTVGIASAISSVSIQMQAIITRSSSANVSVDQAARDLHIDPIALIWERAILVLLLIFLSGWSRQQERSQQGQGQGPQGQSDVDHLDPQVLADTVVTRLTQVNQDCLTQALDRFDQAQQAAIQQALDHLEQANKLQIEEHLTSAGQSQVTLMEQASKGVIGSRLPELQPVMLPPGQGQSLTLSMPAGGQSLSEVKWEAQSEGFNPVRRRAEGQGSDGIRRDVPLFIAEHLARQGTLPRVRQIMEVTGCSRNTARKYVRQVGIIAQCSRKKRNQAEQR